MNYVIFLIIWFILGFCGTFYLSKKLDQINQKIDRRNSKESKNRLLFRHDD
tara:strand:+ start:16 stop:168 length:153 start_codon:yes stop_codon:yes gene_type:complete